MSTVKKDLVAELVKAANDVDSAAKVCSVFTVALVGLMRPILR